MNSNTYFNERTEEEWRWYNYNSKTNKPYCNKVPLDMVEVTLKTFKNKSK